MMVLCVKIGYGKEQKVNPEAGAPTGGPPGRLMMLVLVDFRKVYKL